MQISSMAIPTQVGTDFGHGYRPAPVWEKRINHDRIASHRIASQGAPIGYVNHGLIRGIESSIRA
jgi:hypothetical protein